MKRIVEIGFPKCGQNSLVAYLNKLYNNPRTDESGSPYIQRHECIWRKDGLDIMKEWDKKGYQAVIITREPVARIWSSYHYFGYSQQMNWEEYLCMKSTGERSFGEENPIIQSNYDAWIKRFEEFNPIVYNLENLVEELGNEFPALNITKNQGYRKEKSITSPVKQIPPDYRKLAEHLIKHERKNEIRWTY